MGRRTSSVVCSNGPQRSKQHAPINHKTAHFTVCQAPGQTAEHQFFIKQLQRNVLKAGSKTTSVPVVTMKPPAPALTTLLTHDTIEIIVLWSGSSNLSRRRRNKQRLVLHVDSQRWFLYPSIFLNQQGPVRYFYCSTKVFNAYSDEGLTNPRMPSQDFMEMEFFERELEATKKQVEEKGQKKTKGLKLNTLVACADFVNWN